MPTPAEVAEKALRKHMRLRTGDMMSGAEAEDAARIAVQTVAAELRAEGERERERLKDSLDNPAIHNWVTAWEMIANFIEGEPKRGSLTIVNEPAAAGEAACAEDGSTLQRVLYRRLRVFRCPACGMVYDSISGQVGEARGRISSRHLKDIPKETVAALPERRTDA